MIAATPLKKYRFEILLFVCYLLLALVFTYPLVLNLNNSIYGVRGDHFAQLWESWWRKEALLSGKSLTFTPLIYAPTGFDFSSFPLQPLPTVLNLGLTLLTNEVLALNILLLLSFPLSGLAVYFLVRRLFGVCKARPCKPSNHKAWPYHSLAAAFSGLIYAFSMYHFSHAWEHSTLTSIYWMPFYVWALVNFDEKKNVKSAAIAALLFALVLLDNFYYGFMTFLFSAFFFLFRGRNYLSRQGLKSVFLFSVLCFLFTSPVVLPLLTKSISPQSVDSWLVQESYERSLHDLNWFSARPWFYFLPSPYHSLWGSVSKSILNWLATKQPEYLMKPYARVEHNLFLGWTALALSTLAILKCLRDRKRSVNASVRQWRQWVWVFFALGIVMAIFSAPPMATLSGFKIYFPSHFLYRIFPMFSAYARFGVLVLLCVAVLAGFGASFLFSVAARFYRAHHGQHKVLQLLLPIAYCLLPAFVLLEVLLPPFNVDLTPPDAYLWLKEQPGDFIVVEFPPRTDHSELLYQRVHGKRLFDPVLENAQDILHAPEDQVSAQALLYRNLRERPQDFPPLEVKYVIFHEGDPFLNFNLGYFGPPDFKMVYESQGMAVYEIVETE